MTTAITLKEAWDWYKENKFTDIIDQQNDSIRWKRHIRPVLGDRTLESIKGVDILRLRRILEGKKLKPQTIYHCLNLVRRLFNSAIKWELYSGTKPHFEMPTVHNQRTRFLHRDEATRLLEEIKRRSQLTHDITFFALLTGLRSKEILTLKVQNVDMKARVAHILDSKSGSRSIPLCQPAADLLEPYLHSKKRSDTIFLNAGRPISRVSRTYVRSVEFCRLNDGVSDARDRVVFHTLRHTFASWLVMKGTPIATVSQLLGHSCTKITMRYAHLAPEFGHEVVSRLW